MESCAEIIFSFEGEKLTWQAEAQIIHRYSVDLQNTNIGAVMLENVKKCKIAADEFVEDIVLATIYSRLDLISIL